MRISNDRNLCLKYDFIVHNDPFQPENQNWPETWPWPILSNLSNWNIGFFLPWRLNLNYFGYCCVLDYEIHLYPNVFIYVYIHLSNVI